MKNPFSGILIVVATLTVLVGVVFGMSTCVDAANAGGEGEPYSISTWYDEATSVFCATRAKAVSCVYVPRDTVRSTHEGRL